MNQLTELLGRLQAGDPEARDALFAAAYTELHRIARARLRDGGRNTVLDTTCLVHESYLRFVHAGELRAEDRRAFFNAFCRYLEMAAELKEYGRRCGTARRFAPR
jgi:DNA-directed RNA polymerase specialized sigma24 family protein